MQLASHAVVSSKKTNFELGTVQMCKTDPTAHSLEVASSETEHATFYSSQLLAHNCLNILKSIEISPLIFCNHKWDV